MSVKEKEFLNLIFRDELELKECDYSRTYTSFEVKKIRGKKLKKKVWVNFYNDLIYCHDRDPNYLGKLNVFYFEDNTQFATYSYEKRYFKSYFIEDSQSLTRILKDMGVYEKAVPEKICKKLTLVVEVDNGFETTGEELLDEKLADTFADNGFALIESKEYEDIDWD